MREKSAKRIQKVAREYITKKKVKQQRLLIV